MRKLVERLCIAEFILFHNRDNQRNEFQPEIDTIQSWSIVVIVTPSYPGRVSITLNGNHVTQCVTII